MADSDSQDNALGAWLDLVWKHKWLVFFFGVLVLAATTVYTRRQVKIYEATTQLVIDLAAPRYMPASGGQEVVSLGSTNWDTRQFFETQYRIIRSRMVAKLVVDEEGLSSDLDFLGVADIEDPEERARALQEADAVSTLVARVRVEPVSDSHVVLIKVQDRSPKRAQRLADAVAKAYAEQNVGRKVSAVGEAVTWLKSQSDQVRGEQDAAENALLDFKRNNDIMNASLGAKQQLNGQNLQDAQRQLREARSASARLRGELDAVKKLSASEAEVSVAAVLENGLVQRLKQQLVDLQNERSELLKRYLDKHPDVRTADTKIKRVRAALTREVDGIRRSIQRAYDSARKAEGEMAADVRRLGDAAKSLHGKELSYKRLEAAIDSKKRLSNELLVRLKEAELQAEAKANNVRVLDGALLPSRPVRPRLLLNLSVAGLLAFIGAIALAFLVEQLDATVKNQSILEGHGLTFLGVIPSIQSAARATGKRFKGRNQSPDRYVMDNPNSTVAECVRTIRTNLLFMAPEREMRSIVVTSAGPREGKTCTCVNIGTTMAMAGSKILLVDSDLRRPRLHKIFDFTNEKGLTDLVMDDAVPVSAVTQTTHIENLDMLSSGPLPPNPAELLHTKGFRRTMDKLLAEYDRVIFDSPPVVAVTDAQILGMQADGAVLVVRAGRTSREMLKKAVRLLSDVNVNILGALLNNLDVSRRGYGQYYYQYYGRYGSTRPMEPTKSES